MEDDADVPQLSAHTLMALQEYLRDQAVESDGGHPLVSEDWRMSQFWYDESTSASVAAEVHHLSSSSNIEFRVACIACPTLFVELKVW